jgi:predicted dehydrogenase
MNIAIIGAGGIAGAHNSAYVNMQNVKVVAVVDIRIEKAMEIAKPHGARVYTSVDDMLKNEKPDMMDVCVPSFLHEEMVVKAAKNKIHVLCEKPMTLDLESAKRMQAAAEKNNVFLMIAHVIRFWPEYMYLKKVYDNKTYGELRHASFSRLSQKSGWSWENWMNDKEKSGLAPLDLHIHDADFIFYLLGKPMAVRSYGMEDEKVISYISTQYIYNDVLVTAEGGWHTAPYPFDMAFRVVFEEAILEFKGGRLMLYPVVGEVQLIDLGDKMKISNINLTSSDGYYNEIKYFIECIESNNPPQVVSPAESVECLDMVLKELQSFKTGQTISLT